MREKEIRRLIKIVEESNIAELEISRWGRKVCIRKNVLRPTRENAPAETSTIQTEVLKIESKAEATTIADDEGLARIESPMVGTFYRAPAPNAKPFVEVNDIIRIGQTVCIVEAMKLMNEIESEVSGRVVKILVENGRPVEYNQPLFLIQPT